MLRCARQLWRIRHLLVLPLLLFAPVLEVLDGDVEDTQLGATPTVVAAAKHNPLVDAPSDLAPPEFRQPRLRTPTPPPPAWRPSIPCPVRCWPAVRAAVRAGDTDADPA